jgi:hypothetical protein
MPETLTHNQFVTDHVTKAALEVVRNRPDFWVAYSGETITGAETADYLQALVEVLEKRGWVHTYKGTDPGLPAPDDSLSVKQMILTLWRHAREALEQDRGPITLSFATYEVDDRDAHTVADRVLDALVAARTGTRTAQATAWAARTIRTWDEVRSLLDAGAAFARAHGPR